MALKESWRASCCPHKVLHCTNMFFYCVHLLFTQGFLLSSDHKHLPSSQLLWSNSVLTKHVLSLWGFQLFHHGFPLSSQESLQPITVFSCHNNAFHRPITVLSCPHKVFDDPIMLSFQRFLLSLQAVLICPKAYRSMFVLLSWSCLLFHCGDVCISCFLPKPLYPPIRSSVVTGRFSTVQSWISTVCTRFHLLGFFCCSVMTGIFLNGIGCIHQCFQMLMLMRPTKAFGK